MAEMEGTRLNKYIADSGFCSRREADRLIQEGRVKVDGVAAGLGERVLTGMTVTVDGRALTGQSERVYILLNKPANYETSHKPHHYPSVFSLFPDHMRNIDMQAIGRLDADTTGVLLVTNDGQFNHRMTSPKHKVPKLYQVRLKHPADNSLQCSLRLLLRSFLSDTDHDAGNGRETDPIYL